MNKYKKVLIREIIVRILFVIVIVLSIIFIFGCSKNTGIIFNSYADVTTYCYNQTFTNNCDIEKCVMINSATFNDNIKFSTEKNYYQCKLLECKS